MLPSLRMMLSRKSSVSRRMQYRNPSSKSGNCLGSGRTTSMFLNWSHWPAKFSTSANDFRIAQHATHLALENSGRDRTSLTGESQQLRIGRAHSRESRTAAMPTRSGSRARRSGPADPSRSGTESPARPGWPRGPRRCLLQTNRLACAQERRSRHTSPISSRVAGRRNAREAKLAMIMRGQAALCLPVRWPQT